MSVIEKTIHIGADGMLRIEVPLDRRNEDVEVTISIQDSRPSPGTDSQSDQCDPWAPYRSKLEAAGSEAPAPGSWSRRTAPLLEIDGPPVSQTLVEDRR